MLNNMDILVKKAIDNWSYEFLDRFLDKKDLSNEHLILMYKLGRYDFFLQNLDYIDRLALLLDTNSNDLYDFMHICLKDKTVNENFLLGKFKNSYMSFL
ncbi:TPA: sugar transferase, partial [Campylobacter jejuni]|nr:sugar transferase [Campylobacter jejuni]